MSKEQAILDAASELFLPRGFKSIGMLLYHVMHTRVLGVRKKLSQAQMKKLVTEVVDDFLLGYAPPG